MTANVFIPPDLCEHALQLATHESFPEIVRILKLFKEGSAELQVDEARGLLEFARFLVQRAELHFPYWDDSRAPYLREHEEGFQEINMGLHEKIFSYIGSSFPDLIK
jgi:hypothetical protein